MKKYFKASNKSVAQVQIVAMAAALIGLFLANFNLVWLLTSVVCYYLYSSVGVSMMMHRYWTHKGFTFRSEFVRKIFTAIAVLAGRGSPLAWVYVHRLHHTHADKEQDPHSPRYVGFRFFGLRSTKVEEIKIFVIKDLMNKEQIFINDWYVAFVLAWILFLALFGFDAFYFIWALPVFVNQMTQDLFNYFAHVRGGYRNSNSDDDSQNVVWLWPFILGEAWHNNHHSSPRAWDFKQRWWELDPVSWLVRLVKTN